MNRKMRAEKLGGLKDPRALDDLDFLGVNYRLARAQVKRLKGDIAGAKKDYVGPK